ncbi:MAG: hypothetical protein K6U11_09230 [bacterium]|nr:hypothetical protein [bacterium]
MNPKEKNDTIDYLALIKRRKKYILIPFVSIFLTFTILAFALPPIYKSSCTILIEGQQVPPDFIRSTVNSFAEQTIQLITQQIQSRSKLLEIINQLNLYADLRNKKTIEEIIEEMRSSIQLKMISTKMSGNQNDKSTSATIAFSLSFEGKDPEKVQKVTDLLASLYLEENLKTRERRAKTTSEFIEAELKNLNESITQLETKIAQFKEKHFLDLPEMRQTNLQMVQSLERELANVQQQIENVESRRVYLEGLLSTVEPYLSKDGKASSENTSLAKQKLIALYTDYLAMEGSLSEKHPDMIRIKKQIKSLEQEVSFKDALEVKQQKLRELKAELAAKKAVFSAGHKDVVMLTKTIEHLENDIAQMTKEEPVTRRIIEGIIEAPRNPAYVNITTQIETARLELESLKKNRIALQEKIMEYQKRLEMAPQVELEYKLLTRDYDNARSRYQETLNKLMEARTSEALEKNQKAERLTILDPAFYPEKPYKPNRLAIVLIGFVLALGAGVGCASIREYTDRAIYSEAALAAISRKPTLAVISFMEIAADKGKRLAKSTVVAIVFLIAALIGALMIHLFVIRLDILWFKALRYGSRLISIIF